MQFILNQFASDPVPELLLTPIDLLTNVYVGEINRELKYQANDILTGATCTLEMNAPNHQKIVLTMTVSSDGTYCYRLTQATDFPIAGTYQTMVKVIKTDGSTYWSDEHDLVVLQPI